MRRIAVLSTLILLAACTPTPAESDPAVTTPAVEPGPAGDSDCLEGTWVADPDSIRESTLAAPGLTDLDPEVTVTGESVTTLDDGVITTVYTDQQTQLTWTTDGVEYRMVISYDGTLTGSYSTTASELTISDVDLTALSLENATFIGGERLELPGVADAVHAGFEMGGTSTYTCTADQLTLVPVGVDTSGFVNVLRRR